MASNTTKIPSGYKQTKIGIIPEDWEVKKLGDCSIISGDYGINAAAVEYSEQLPTYLRITDIDEEGNFLRDSKVSVNHKDSVKFLLDDEDFVFARTGASVGKTYLHNKEKHGDLVFAGFLIRYRLNRTIILPKFLKMFTQTFEYNKWVKIYSVRSGQPGINSSEYSHLKIPLPPLPEQHAIAACLSTWDKAIDKTQKLIAQLKERNKGLMQRLLTGKVRLKDKNGERFCGEWKERKLGEVAKGINSSLSLNSLRLEDGGYPVYGATNLIGYLKDYKFDTEYIGIVKDGAGVGRISFHPAKSSIIGTMTSIHANESNNIHFLFYLLCQIKFEKFISGSTIPHIYFKDYSKTKINIPNLKEQTAIASVLDKATQEVQLQEEKMAALKEQKKGLMQVLLTGKLRLRSAQEKRLKV